MTELLHPILALILYAIADAAGPVKGDTTIAFTLAELGGAALVIAIMGYALRRRALATARSASPAISAYRAFRRARRRMAWIALLVFGTALFATPWIKVAAAWIPPEIPLVARLLGILPYALLLVVGTLPLSLALQTLSVTHGRVRVFFSELRPQLVMLLAFLCALSLGDLSWHFPNLRVLVETDTRFSALATGTLLLAILILLPAFVRFLWPSRPLPDGALRARLTDLARTAKVSFRDILVPQTGTQPFINAWVTGIVAPVRYIFITDAMLRELTDDEIAQVFAHELGHARMQHFLIYLFVASAFLLGILSLDSVVSEHPLFGWIGFAVALLLYLGVFFGRLSRQLESHADLFGARLTCSPLGYVETMGRIAALTGSAHLRASWRYFSIPERVQIVTKSFADASFFRSFRRRTRLLLALLVFMNLAAAGAYAWRVREEMDQPPFFRELARARVLRADCEERRVRAWHRPELTEQLLAQALTHYRAAEQELAQVSGSELDRAEIFDEIAAVLVERGELAAAARARGAAELLRASVNAARGS